MDRIAQIALQLAHEHRQRQIDEAADRRRAAMAQPRNGHPIRHAVGHALIRLGHALDGDHAPMQPARPR